MLLFPIAFQNTDFYSKHQTYNQASLIVLILESIPIKIANPLSSLSSVNNMLVYILNYLQGMLVCTVFTMLHLLPKITKKKMPVY